MKIHNYLTKQKKTFFARELQRTLLPFNHLGYSRKVIVTLFSLCTFLCLVNIIKYRNLLKISIFSQS